ncbi:MAG: hypothetical protein F6K22_19375 [Okeania sp. SIO2F4]|uniref:hypothetical protein n=1 Tax=Okeania sp. SIO2F4 TaxID=2607790 RepID=UPI001429D786|nr:hypothetical protein [Okeania sp. SIO2F4]NES04803.1 hypothetical protein [Okeania sp. SIO2F4]
MEDQLRDLITQICQSQNPSPERQKVLNRLLILIQQLPGLYRSSHQNYPEAFNRTLEWASKNIQNFQPGSSWEKSFVIWINGYLKWRVRDLYIADNKYENESIDKPINDDEGQSTTLGEKLPANTLSLLEMKIAELQQAKRQRQGIAVQEYIKTDPEEKLKTSHPRKHPECNCHVLAIRLLLEEKRISNISREISISNQTLYSHWKRKCLPLLQEISSKFGEQP